MAGDELPDISPEDLLRAEQALARLGNSYLNWADADAARLRACLDEMLAPGADPAALLPRLFAISHDMKGQAATFGYPLVSELGNRLCRLIEAHPAPPPEMLDHMAALVDGIARVVAERLEGDGGEVGRELRSRL